jgi:tripartite-type tricarboxylate transporter receptor subunit TctC
MSLAARISSVFSITAFVAGALICVGAAPQAQAQAWPKRPVHLILSQAPGTSPDIAAREIANRLSRLWDQGVVVDNHGGGQNVIGSVTAAIITNPLTFKTLPYDPAKDFTSVAMIAKSPMVVAVSAALPVKNLQELVAYDKAHPGAVSTAHEGPRTFSGMMSAALNSATGMHTLLVPYNGATAAITDTIGGRTQVVLLSSASVVPFIKKGELRPIAITAGKRVVGFEDVPTLAETYPGFEYVGWFALLAPTGTPKDIITRVNRDVNTVMADPELAKKLQDLGLVIDTGKPEMLDAFLTAERGRWGKLVKEIGLQPE